MGKMVKITSATHQSSKLPEGFQKVFGLTIPKPVITRWNTHFRCVKRISELDRNKLNDVLTESDYASLCLSVTDFDKLNDFTKIMQGFNQASELSQGDHYPTILVAPTVVSLFIHLNILDNTCTHFKALIKRFKTGLINRFAGIITSLNLVDIRIDP